MATDALPDEVTLNRLAQRFYEASELHLVRMTDKPLIVKGLRAVFQALAEPTHTTVRTHRPPKKWERDRDAAVCNRLLIEWGEMPEPRPELVTWLNGACAALLTIRQVSE